MAFTFKQLNIPEIIHIIPATYPDERGSFCEVYKQPEFEKAGIKGPFVQLNHSQSAKGTLRGLHYQERPEAQGKLVTVLEGEIFDVAVDIRKGSPTYGKHVSLTLKGDRKEMLYIPEGFAHGFCVLSEKAHVAYYCTRVYSPDHERGILWDDPQLKIAWPIKDPILSKRDQGLPLLV